MHESAEVAIAVGVVAVLVAAAARYGASHALEALGLMSLLIGLRIARAALSALHAMLKLVLWLVQR